MKTNGGLRNTAIRNFIKQILYREEKEVDEKQPTKSKSKPEKKVDQPAAVSTPRPTRKRTPPGKYSDYVQVFKNNFL